VQEVRVGEHGERPEPDQRGRGADEGDAVHGRFVPRAGQSNTMHTLPAAPSAAAW
jgi:hypothetical protein